MLIVYGFFTFLLGNLMITKLLVIHKFTQHLSVNLDNDRIEVPDVVIKEWIWSKANPYQTPEYVKAEQIGWGVPTIQRLWFG